MCRSRDWADTPPETTLRQGVGATVDCDNDIEQRRVAVSYKSNDNNAIYVRMLGDIKAQQTNLTHELSVMTSHELPVMTSCSANTDCVRRLCHRSTVDQSDVTDLCSCRCWWRHRRLLSVTVDKSPKQAIIINNINLNVVTTQPNYDIAMLYLSAGVNSWSFNVFQLDRLSAGRSLSLMALQLFKHYDFIRSFQLDVIQLHKCIAMIESGYDNTNPYHNVVHAADVLQAMHCNLQETRVCNKLNAVEKMCAVIAAASHDVGHPGVNQTFLQAVHNPLTTLYHNSSVLENHHWRTTVSILHQSQLFQHLDIQTWKSIQQTIKLLILATDITRQHEFISTFRRHLDHCTLDLSRNEAHRTFLLQITLKCADICNPCRPWQLSRHWSELVCEEFYRQGDRERELHLPINKLCDRNTDNIASIQIGFMTHVVEPLFVEWSRFAPCQRSRAMLANLRLNRAAWQQHDITDKSTNNLIPSTTTTVTTTKPSKHMTVTNSNSRRHSLPGDHQDDSNDVTSRELRRHSLPTIVTRLLGGVTRLAALEECSPPPQLTNSQYFTFKQCTNTNCTQRLNVQMTLNDRRLSLNNNILTVVDTTSVAMSRKRSRSLVTSSKLVLSNTTTLLNCLSTGKNSLKDCGTNLRQKCDDAKCKVMTSLIAHDQLTLSDKATNVGRNCLQSSVLKQSNKRTAASTMYRRSNNRDTETVPLL